MLKVFETVLQISFGASILAILVIIARAMIKHRHPTLVALLYTLLIVRLIIPFSVESTLSIQNLIGVPQAFLSTQQLQPKPITVNQTDANMFGNEPTNIGTVMKQDANAIGNFSVDKTLMNIAAFVWVAGMVLFFIIVSIFNFRFVQKIKKNRRYGSVNFNALLDECKNAYKLHQKIDVIQVSNIRAAAVCGIFRPKLLISPNTLNNLTEQEKRHVLMHELSHIKHKDTLASLIITILQIVYWFNPILWLVFYLMNQDLEVICDATVIRKLGRAERHSYATTLLHLAELPKPRQYKMASALFISHPKIEKKFLKRRIKMLIKDKKKSFIFMILAVLLIVVIATTGFPSAKQQDKTMINQLETQNQLKGSTTRADVSENDSTLTLELDTTQTETTDSDTQSSDEKALKTQSMNAVGTYKGHIDNHTIEMMVNDKLNTYQLTDITREQAKALTETQTIGFTFEMNDTVNVITRFDDTEQVMNGTYVGLADSHTIEVMNDTNAVYFQLMDHTLATSENLSEGDTIKVVYHMTDKGSNIANAIERLSSSQTQQTMLVTYNGMADPHTIEVSTEEDTFALQLAKDALTQVNSISEGEQVTIIFSKNEHEQLIASSVTSN